MIHTLAAQTRLRQSCSPTVHHDGPTTRRTITPGVAMVPDTLTATGYPLPRLRATGLPRGIQLTANQTLKGTIAGDTNATGTHNVTRTAKNKTGTAVQTSERLDGLNRPSQSTPLLLTGADEGLTVDPDDACALEERDTECMVTKVLHPVRSECPRRVREVALTIRTFEGRPSR